MGLVSFFDLYLENVEEKRKTQERNASVKLKTGKLDIEDEEYLHKSITEMYKKGNP